MKKEMKFLLGIVLVICIIFSMSFTFKIAEASIYTGNFTGYSGDLGISTAKMLSSANTYDYSFVSHSVKERYLYDMSSHNGNEVIDGAPSITVFTHGYGADASHFSNNGSRSKTISEFAYDYDSAIEKVLDLSRFFGHIFL